MGSRAWDLVVFASLASAMPVYALVVSARRRLAERRAKAALKARWRREAEQQVNRIS